MIPLDKSVGGIALISLIVILFLLMTIPSAVLAYEPSPETGSYSGISREYHTDSTSRITTQETTAIENRVNQGSSATSANPVILIISPTQMNQGKTYQYIITGQNFQEYPLVYLNKTGTTEEIYAVVDTQNSTCITGYIDIPDEYSLGLWNLVVMNLDFQEGMKLNAVTIKSALSPPLPTISSINPTGGIRGTRCNFTITGSNFKTNPFIMLNKTGSEDILFGEIYSASTSQIKGSFDILLDTSPGLWNCVVVNDEFGVGMKSNCFTIGDRSPLIITSIVPSKGMKGLLVNVTITGTNLNKDAILFFNRSGFDHTLIGNVYSSTATSMKGGVTIPEDAPLGAWNVGIFDPFSLLIGIKPDSFIVENPSQPTLSSITPRSAYQRSVVNFTLNGNNFLPDALFVLNRSTDLTIPAQVTRITPTQITGYLEIPANADLGPWNIKVINPGDMIGWKQDAFTITNWPAPTITAINPSSGFKGTSISFTVTGTNYPQGTTVVFSNATCGNLTATTVSQTTTSISGTVQFPINVTCGKWNVAVVTADYAWAEKPNLFTLNNPPLPIITSITPASGYFGDAIAFTIAGWNFNSNATVKIEQGYNRMNAFVTGVTGTTQIKGYFAIASWGPAGTWDVVVTNPDGQSSRKTRAFTVKDIPTPTLTTLSPGTVFAGSAGFNLTLTGTNFTANSKVQWNGMNRTTWYISATQLKAAILGLDVATAGVATIRVLNPSSLGDKVSSSKAFNITNGVPTATKLIPSSVNAWSPRFNLTVTGTNFNSQSQVYWNGVTKSTTLINATSLTATIPANDLQIARTYPVWVVNPAPGGGKTANLTFTVNPVAPRMTCSTPESALVGGSAFTLTAIGQNFTAGAAVKWNGVAKSTTFISTTRLNATIPATDLTAAKTVNITVTNPGTSGTSNTVQFPIKYGMPTITSLLPASAKAGGAAFSLKVVGTNFTAASKVQWNGLDRPTTFAAGNLSASITAANINIPGTVAVTVSNPAPGGGTSLSVPFTVQNPQPSITSINPTTKIRGSGVFNLTVTGTNFTAASKFQWNWENRTTWLISATQLKARIEALDVSSPGTFPIMVVNYDGSSSPPTSGTKTFTVT